MKQNYSTLEQFANEALAQVNIEDNMMETIRIRKNSIAMQYYRGQQRGFFDTSGDWQPLDWTLETDSRAQSVMLSDNVFRPQMKSLIKEWSRSRTQLKTKSRNNSRRTVAASRFASELIELYQNKIMNESFRQQEGKFSVLCGNYFRYVHLKRDSKRSPKVRVEKTEVKRVSEESYSCDSCDWQSPQATDSVCPQCGNPVTYNEPVDTEITVGYDRLPVGEPSTILVDPRLVKVPLSTRRMEDHSYLRWTSVDELSRVKRRYKRDDIKQGTQSEPARYALESERSNGASDSIITQGMIDNNATRVEVQRLWLKPDFYYGVTIDEDAQIDGDGDSPKFILKAGIPLDEQFPDGMYLTVADMKLLDAEEQDLADCWSHGTLDELSETPYGDGNDDAIQDQNRINELVAMQMENALFNSFTKTVVNTRLVDPTLFENNSEIVPLNQNVGTDSDPKNSFAQIMPNKLSEEVVMLREQVESSMRNKTGAHLAMSGENDPEVSTATGLSILRDSAVATIGIALALRSEVDVEWAYQILELVQKNWVDAYHETLCGDYSVEEARAFKNCDIRNDLEITVQANSWIPRTEDQLRNDFIAFVTAGGIPGGFTNPQLPREVREAASDIFRQPIDLDALEPDIRVVEGRIDKLLSFGEQLPKPHETADLSPEDADSIEQEYQKAAAVLAGKIEVRPLVDNHEVCIATYVKWAKTDDGENAHPVIKDAIDILIGRHQDMITQLKQQAMGEEAQMADMATQAQAASQAQAQATAQAINPHKTGDPNGGVSPQMPGFEKGQDGQIDQSKGQVAVPG